jgi:hypothetical protein
MYGERHPQITGLIRFNQEISAAARTVLWDKFLKPLGLVNEDAIDLVEVVADNCTGLSANYIQSGAGVVLRTNMRVGGGQLPCSIGFGFTGIGEFNSRKTFHAIQARTVIESKVESTPGVGLVRWEESAADPEVSRVVEVMEILLEDDKDMNGADSSILEKISEDETNELFNSYCMFPLVNVETYAVIRDDAIICGASIARKGKQTLMTNPFVTTDCSSGNEREQFQLLSRLLQREKKITTASIRFMSNDKFMSSVFSDAIPVDQFSVTLTGLEPTVEQWVETRPWTCPPIQF